MSMHGPAWVWLRTHCEHAPVVGSACPMRCAFGVGRRNAEEGGWRLAGGVGEAAGAGSWDQRNERPFISASQPTRGAVYYKRLRQGALMEQ